MPGPLCCADRRVPSVTAASARGTDPCTFLANEQDVMDALFWTMFGIVAYVYAGYPLLLGLLDALGRRRPVRTGEGWPKATLVISAYNEEDVIAAKLDNSLALDYPIGHLQILVVSDACDDRTDEIVASYVGRGVELLRMPERGGKTLGLNAAMRQATGDVVVFSDANAMYEREALRKLVRNFADPEIGAVVGESGYRAPEYESERSEGAYWKYETLIKRLESRLGSVVGGDGAIYAIRRALFVPMPADALSDFVNPLQIVRGGYRVVYEPEARCWESAAEDFAKEFRRKVRIVNRAWRALMTMPGLMNPLRHGGFAIELLSHKLLRWLVPGFLVVLFLANVVLATDSAYYRATLASQCLFYLLAALGWLLRRRPWLPRVIAIPYYFCLVNVASAVGIFDAHRGKTYTTWTTARAKAGS
jgi:cellulose synthase/poly-beta-1,6-N-acetylglucosamine synthase-like glycosyltransferase